MNFRLRLPIGDDDRAPRSEGVDVLARLAVSKTFGPLAVAVNGGYAFVTADRGLNVWLVSVAGEDGVLSGWTAVAEVASFLG